MRFEDLLNRGSSFPAPESENQRKKRSSPYISPVPIGSMYDIFTYIWLIFMVNIAKYTVPYMDPMGLR